MTKIVNPNIFIQMTLWQQNFCLYSQAVRTSMYGRPGACYIDVPGDMVNAKVDRSKIRFSPVLSCSILIYLLIQSFTCVIQFVSVELYPAAQIHQ